MPLCPKCNGKMNRRSDDYFHCRKHGRGRKVMSPPAYQEITSFVPGVTTSGEKYTTVVKTIKPLNISTDFGF